MHRYIYWLVVGILFIFMPPVAEAVDLKWEQISREILDVRTVLVGPQDNAVIYIGTARGVYKSEDSGYSWRIILPRKKTNFLLSDPHNKNCIYAATQDGLWYSRNQGRNWKVIFKGKSYLERNCTSLAFSPSKIFLGTAGGLFVTQDKSRSWHKTGGKLDNIKILAIAFHQKNPDNLYVASVEGVYKTSDAGISWNRVYTAHSTEDGNEREDANDNSDESERFSKIRYIVIDPRHPDNVYLATRQGVYKSENSGLSWDSLSDYGLLNQDVRFLYFSRDGRLYAVTKQSIFDFFKQRWQELSFALPVNETRFITMDGKDNLYAASDRGLFKANIYEAQVLNVPVSKTQEFYTRNEPDIRQVQEAAIKYAEVELKKIKDWRKQARIRAFLPKVTVDMDCDRNKTVSSNIWGIYSSYSGGVINAPGRYYVGPNDETRYYYDNWGVSLTWDLGDFIWSNAQTSIDVRSRLMVQLRDDVLDEVTKLYFERIRVKMELEDLGITERKKRSGRELKLAELAASIDALTGGYFSKNIKK